MNEHDLLFSSLLVAFQGIVLSGILHGMKKGSKYLHRSLAMLVFSLSLILFTECSAYAVIPLVEEINAVLYYLLGPFIYLYIRSLSVDSKCFIREKSIHFIPALTVVILFLLSYMPLVPMELVNAFYEYNWLGASLVEGFYLLLSVRLLLQYRTTMQRNSVGREEQPTTMLLQFLLFYSILFLVDFVCSLILFDELWAQITPIVLTLLWFLAVVYLLLRWPQEYEAVKEVLKSQNKYEKCALSERESGILFEKLKRTLEDKKHYLEPALSLPLLAEELGATTHEVSYCINSVAGQNFATFIGVYRVAEAKELLRKKSGRGFSIQQIALHSGFSSKSTFNRIFKTITGQTPTQYRDSTLL